MKAASSDAAFFLYGYGALATKRHPAALRQVEDPEAASVDASILLFGPAKRQVGASALKTNSL